MAYYYLAIAILSEVLGTSMLKASNGFTKPIPSVICLFGYSISFYFLSLVLKVIPMGLSYAIWSGFGIVLISIVGLVFYRQQLDYPALLGIFLILSGVVVIHLYSESIKL